MHTRMSLFAALASLSLLAACGSAEDLGGAAAVTDPPGGEPPVGSPTALPGPLQIAAPDKPAEVPFAANPFSAAEIRRPLPSQVRYARNPAEVDLAGRSVHLPAEVETDARVGSIALERPAAPTQVNAFALDGCALVRWTAPVNVPVLSFTIRASSGATAPAPHDATQGKICGLQNHQRHSFTVTAAGLAGEGVASDPSNAVTPVPAP